MPAHTWAQTPFLSPSSVSPCPLCDVCPLSDGQQLRLALIRHDRTHPRQPQHTAIPLIPMRHPLCVILTTSGQHTGTRSLSPSYGMSHILSDTQSLHSVHSVTHHCHGATHSETITFALNQGGPPSASHTMSQGPQCHPHTALHIQFQAGSVLHCLISASSRTF